MEPSVSSVIGTASPVSGRINNCETDSFLELMKLIEFECGTHRPLEHDLSPRVSCVGFPPSAFIE